MNELEIDELVRKVQAGDRDAFSELVFAVRKELRVFLSAHASSIDMVEEILQSTLVVCYENIQKYELRGTFLPWIKGIGRNLLLKELHARSRYVLSEADVLDRIVAESALASAERDDAREEEWLVQLEQCIKKLPEDWRQMVQKRYFDRLSVKALARLFHRSETSTAVTLFRIRDMLRTCMLREGHP